MAEDQDLKVLAALPLFHALPDEQLFQLRSLLHFSRVPQGLTLIAFDQPSEVVYVLQRGTVKVHVEQATGIDVILAIRGPGEVIGELGVLEQGRRTASVQTLEPCELFWLDGNDIKDCLQTMPLLTYNLARILAARLRVASTQFQLLAAENLPGRLAYQLLAFADAYGKSSSEGGVVIPLRLTQSDLGSLVGSSRERVNKVLTQFRQNGYISSEAQGYLVIRDRAALERLFN